MQDPQNLTDEILSQIQTGEDLKQFLTQIQKRGLEKLLEGEHSAHLGYGKNEKSASPNARNGYTTEKVKTSLGESHINVPRDREASFNPMIVPKRQILLMAWRT